MAELIMYKEQLMQVQALLDQSPEDESLLKLASDLKELIRLQQELNAPKEEVQAASDIVEGNTCEAVSSTDGVYYSAVIEGLHDSGKTVSVRFTAGPQSGACIKVKTASLRKVKSVHPGGKAEKAGHDGSKQGSMDQPLVVGVKRQASKQEEAEEAEKRKLKNARKKEKAAEAERQRHADVAQWNRFATKALGGKKSIFATPDDPYGKVGVGTCNIGGKKMTDFTQRGKWKKGEAGGEEEEEQG